MNFLKSSIAIRIGDLLKWITLTNPKILLLDLISKWNSKQPINLNLRENLHSYYYQGFHNLNYIRQLNFLGYTDQHNLLNQLVLFDANLNSIQNLIPDVLHQSYLINQIQSLDPNFNDEDLIKIESIKSISEILLELFEKTHCVGYQKFYQLINKSINARMNQELQNHYHDQIFKDIFIIKANDYPIWAYRNIYLEYWPTGSLNYLMNVLYQSNQTYQNHISKGQSINRYKHYRSRNNRYLNQSRNRSWYVLMRRSCQNGAELSRDSNKYTHKKRQNIKNSIKNQEFTLV